MMRAHRIFQKVFPQLHVGLTRSVKALLPVHSQQQLYSCPRNTHSEAIPHSGLRGEGLGLKKKYTKTQKTDTKDIKNRRSYGNMLRWCRKVTSKYI